MEISAIIVAAGSSRRMGFDKLGADLCGESVLTRSLQAFEACEKVGEICVVTTRDKIASIRQIGVEKSLSKLTNVIEGGAERHLSVAHGLEQVCAASELVAIHDGARPLVTPAAIVRCAEVAAETGAASLAHPIVDTLKRSNERGEVAASVSRDDLWAMETPQIFHTSLIRMAYQQVIEKGLLVTDEVSAIEAMGRAVSLVRNDEPNGKITVAADLEIARAIWNARSRGSGA